MARKLLLADDSITIQKVVELVLAEEGYDIKASGNGEDALSALSSFKPDVVLADIDMPKMNGYQLCERIKTNPATKNIPVILLAGAFEPLDDELARNVGAEDFIVKPFESQELIDKINAVLSGGAAVKGIAEEEVAVSEVMEGIEPEEDLWTMEELVSEPLATEALWLGNACSNLRRRGVDPSADRRAARERRRVAEDSNFETLARAVARTHGSVASPENARPTGCDSRSRRVPVDRCSLGRRDRCA